MRSDVMNRTFPSTNGSPGSGTIGLSFTFLISLLNKWAIETLCPSLTVQTFVNSTDTTENSILGNQVEDKEVIITRRATSLMRSV